MDSVEALSGYDLLKLLPDQVEIAVERSIAPLTGVTASSLDVLFSMRAGFSGFNPTRSVEPQAWGMTSPGSPASARGPQATTGSPLGP